MNWNTTDQEQAVLRYQADRLQDLLSGMVKCCEERVDFEHMKFGLPCSEVKCLLLLGRERYLTLTQISTELGVAKSRATALVDALMNKGLVERIADPKDARIKLISLTREGRQMQETVSRHQAAAHEQVLRKLPPQERDQVLTCLDKLRYCMELVKEELMVGNGYS